MLWQTEEEREAERTADADAEEAQAREWVVARRVGRDRFVWRERVCRDGLALGAVLGTWSALSAWAAGTVWTWDALGDAGFFATAPLTLAAGCARWEWSRRERRHQTRARPP